MRKFAALKLGGTIEPIMDEFSCDCDIHCKNVGFRFAHPTYAFILRVVRPNRKTVGMIQNFMSQCQT